MSRITLIQGLLMHLNQTIEVDRREYMTKEQAYQRLKSLTEQDFGHDVERWQNWLKENTCSTIQRQDCGSQG